MIELCVTVGIGKSAVLAIIRELGYRKVCARWMLKLLTVVHKTVKKHL
jgi:hypothetical protein